MTPEPDDDEPLGQGVEVVDLLPGEDPLPVGASGVHDPGSGTGRDQHDVGLELVHPVVGLGPHGGGRGEHGAPGEHPHTDLGQPGGDVVALRCGQVEHPGVDLVQVGHGIGDLVTLGVLEVHAELVGGLELAHVVGGGDERLAGHAVGEHRRATEPVALDHGDLGPEVRGDEGGLVPTGPSTEDDDSARPRAHVAIQPLRARSAPSAPTTRAHTVARRGKWPVNGAGAAVTFELRLAEHTWFCSEPSRGYRACRTRLIAKPGTRRP